MATARERDCCLECGSHGHYYSCLPVNIPNTLAKPPRTKAVRFEANKKRTKAAREDTSLKMPIITEANRGSKLIPALSRNGAL